MAELPLDEAVARFHVNEERINKFVNAPGGEESFETSEGQTVPVLPKMIEAVSLKTAQADAAAVRAEAAEGNGFVNANLYGTAAAGIAATVEGEQFQVLSADGLEYVRYRHDAGGVAFELPGRYPEAGGFREIARRSDYLEDYDTVELVDPATVLVGKFVDATTGALVNDSNNSATDFIPVNGEKFRGIYRGLLGQGIGGIAGYDDEKIFVEPVIHPAQDGLSGARYAVIEITNPQIKFIRATCVIVQGDTPSIKSTAGGVSRVVADSALFIAEQVRDSLIDTLDLMDGYAKRDGFAVRASDGLVFASNDYEETGLIPVEQGMVIDWTGWIQSSVGICGYDESGIYVATIYNPSVDSSPLGSAVSSLRFVIDNASIKAIRASNRKSNGVPLTLTSTTTYNAATITQKIAEAGGAGGAVKAPVRIRFISATRFEVDSLASDGSYVSHRWDYADRPIYSEQGWYCSQIFHNGNWIVQGNYNTINIMRDGVSDDDIWVGIGHGCETFLWSQFYLDGLGFDPSTATEMLEGREFKIQSLSEFYTPDRTASIAEAGSVASTVAASPLEVRAQRVAEMTIEGDNVLTRAQKLLIKKDGVHFKTLFGAMQQTQQPTIGGVITLNDKDGTRNYFPVSADDPQPLAPSTIRLSNGVNFGEKNCFATRVTAEGGDDAYRYVVSTWAENADSSQIKKNHVQAYLQQSGGNKFYFQPVITSQIVSAYPEYLLDEFNSGDVIEVRSRTTIRVSAI